jgi:hypothetical protein
MGIVMKIFALFGLLFHLTTFSERSLANGSFGSYTIQSMRTSQYISAEYTWMRSNNGILTGKDIAGPWETFQFIRMSESRYCIYSFAHDLFVSAQPSGAFEYRNECLLWEIFEVKQDTGLFGQGFTLQTHFGKYIAFKNGKIDSVDHDEREVFRINSLISINPEYIEINIVRSFDLQPIIQAIPSLNLTFNEDEDKVTYNESDPIEGISNVDAVQSTYYSNGDQHHNFYQSSPISNSELNDHGNVNPTSEPDSESNSNDSDSNNTSDSEIGGYGGDNEDDYTDRTGSTVTAASRYNDNVLRGYESSPDHVQASNNIPKPSIPGLNGETITPSDATNFINEAKNYVEQKATGAQLEVRRDFIFGAEIFNDLANEARTDGRLAEANDKMKIALVLAKGAISFATDIAPGIGLAKDLARLATPYDTDPFTGAPQDDLDKAFILAAIAFPSFIAKPAKQIFDKFARPALKGMIKGTPQSIKTSYDNLVNSIRSLFKKHTPIGNLIIPIRKGKSSTETLVNSTGRAVKGNPKVAIESAKKITDRLSPGKIKTYLSNVDQVPRETLIKDMESIGLKLKGGSPDGRFMEFIDHKGRVRAKIHPPDGVTTTNHLHIYDSNGNSLNKVLEPVKKTSPDAHVPIQ